MERKKMDNRTRVGGAALSLLATTSMIVAIAGCSQDQPNEEVGGGSG